jgi:hypothetical protein
MLVGEEMVKVSDLSPNVSKEAPRINSAEANDNQVDVEIEPDVKSNSVYINICSCSFILNCFTRDTSTKN